MNLDCKACRPQLSPYLEGELKPSERESIESHLAGCSSCSAELAGLKGTLVQLKELRQPGIPSDFRQQVWEKIDTENRWVRLRRWLLEPWYIKLPAEALAMAAVMLLVIQVTLIINPRPGPVPVAPEGPYPASQTLAEVAPRSQEASPAPRPALEAAKKVSIAKELASAETAVAGLTVPPGQAIHIRLIVSDPSTVEAKLGPIIEESRAVRVERPAPTRYHLVLARDQAGQFIKRLSELGQTQESSMTPLPADFHQGMAESRQRDSVTSITILLDIVQAEPSQQP
jgi:anti-sigma factor RsiW